MAAGEGGGRRCKKWQTLAGVLLVSFLAISALCLSLRGWTKIAQLGDSKESSAVEVTRGRIFFDLKPLDNRCSSTGETDDLVKTDLLGMDYVTKEAEWRLLNTSLQCSPTKMTLEVKGPGSADFELYFGDSCTLPLSQVPQMCGFSVEGNSTGLTLTVGYEGCNVKQENGSFVLFLSWRKTAIKLACTVLPNPDTTVPSTSPEPVQQFLQATLPPKQWPLRRTKRFFRNPYANRHSYERYHYQPYQPYRPQQSYKSYRPYVPYVPYVPCYYMKPFTTTTAPPTTTTPWLNLDVWRKVLNLNTAHEKNTIPQNTIEQYLFPKPEDLDHLKNGARQTIFKKYLHNALGFSPQMHPLSHAIANNLTPKPCRRRWLDGTCLDFDKSVRQVLNLPLSRLSFKNENLDDKKPVYRGKQKSNVIWDQLPWFNN